MKGFPHQARLRTPRGSDGSFGESIKWETNSILYGESSVWSFSKLKVQSAFESIHKQLYWQHNFHMLSVQTPGLLFSTPEFPTLLDYGRVAWLFSLRSGNLWKSLFFTQYFEHLCLCLASDSCFGVSCVGGPSTWASFQAFTPPIAS